MIKRFVVLRRKPGMNVEQFRHHWENVHGPLIAKLPKLRRYVQHHVHSEIKDDHEIPIDGIAEIWFDSEEDQKAAYASEEYQRVIADQPNLFERTSRCVHPVMTDRSVEIKS